MTGDATRRADAPPPPGSAAAIERLRVRRDFLAAARGRRVVTGSLILQTRRRAGGPARLGFTVSRKGGNAVERNRVRRRLREAVRTSAASRLRAGHDYVLIGRRATLTAPFERIVADLAAALAKAHRGAATAQTDRTDG